MTENTEIFHRPVLLRETLEYLNVQPGKKYIDATVGGASHAIEIVKRGGRLLGIDCDPEAIEAAKKRLESIQRYRESIQRYKDIRIQGERAKKPRYIVISVYPYILVPGNFKEIDSIAREHGFDPVAGIIYDLGMSSWQIEKSGRGFSFLKDEPLDMRMDPSLVVKASDLINALSENELTKLFKKYGEEQHARTIARAVVHTRRVAGIETTRQLSDLVLAYYADKRGYQRGRMQKLHPATKVFQALRIAVNDELNNLKESLPRAARLLEPGGRLVVISFHSLEDRTVKRFGERPSNRLEALTKKPIRPSKIEIEKNPKARSAKMRAFEKIEKV